MEPRNQLHLAIFISLIVTMVTCNIDPHYGNECPCPEEKGLVCGFDDLCTCRSGEVFARVCQRTLYRKRQCWNQCVGVPNYGCFKNLSPFNVGRKELVCVDGATCIYEDQSKSRGICRCNRGFVMNKRGTLCESEVFTRRKNADDSDEWTKDGRLKPHPSIGNDTYVSQADKSRFTGSILMFCGILVWLNIQE